MSDQLEIFHRTIEENLEYDNLDYAGDPLPAGYYYREQIGAEERWFCPPSCLPEGELIGPYDTYDEAYAAIQDSTQ